MCCFFHCFFLLFFKYNMYNCSVLISLFCVFICFSFFFSIFSKIIVSIICRRPRVSPRSEVWPSRTWVSLAESVWASSSPVWTLADSGWTAGCGPDCCSPGWSWSHRPRARIRFGSGAPASLVACAGASGTADCWLPRNLHSRDLPPRFVAADAFAVAFAAAACLSEWPWCLCCWESSSPRFRSPGK